MSERTRSHRPGRSRGSLPTKLARIADERQKLLRAFYGNAIPIELLKSKQDRLTVEERAAKQELEAAEADLSGWGEVLRTAIELAGNVTRPTWRPDRPCAGASTRRCARLST
jgi:hypothetical protein